MTTLEIALGPMLWLLFASSMLATIAAIIIGISKRPFAFAAAASSLPFFVASAGAAFTLRELQAVVAEEGGGIAVVAPSVARALMLAMLGFAATLAPAIPSAMSTPKGNLSRWPLIPLFIIPVFAAAQIPFGFPPTALIRLVAYLGVAGALAKRRGSLAILLPVVAAGECAAVGVAYVDLFTTLSQYGSAETMAESARDVAVGRWFGVAAFACPVAAMAIAKDPRAVVLAPLCLVSAWVSDATAPILNLLR